MIAALKGRGGGTYVHLSGSGTAGNVHAKDGQKPGDFTDWAELIPHNPNRHAVEKAVVLADGAGVRTGLFRCPILETFCILG